MKKLIIIIVLFFIGFSAFGDTILRFGLFPAYNPKTMIRLFSPIARKIEEDTAVTIQLVSASTKEIFYSNSLSGEYDFLWTNNFSYIQIHDDLGMNAIVRGAPSFRGIVMVRKDSGIDGIQDLSGKKLAAISKISLAGFLFLRNDLADLGISVYDDMCVSFIPESESFPFLIYRKTIDAAVYSEDTLIRSGLFESIRSELKIIHQSPPIPQFPICAGHDLDRDLVRAIQYSLTSISRETPLYAEILDELNLHHFEAVDDADYDSFRELYEKTIRYNRQE